jgi:hypothetical protein
MQITVVDNDLPAGSTYCTDANPDDQNSDTIAIQTCLCNYDTVILRPGSVGYLIDDAEASCITPDNNHALILTANKTLKSTGSGSCWIKNGGSPIAKPDRCAALKASSGTQGSQPLTKRILKGTGNNWAIDRVIFDGNGAARRDPDLQSLRYYCDPNHARPGNIYIWNDNSDGWKITNSVSMKAMCGSALVANGTGYQIKFNFFDDNGEHDSLTYQPNPWADGITALQCNGSIEGNWIWDSTDVGIAGGGSNDTTCSIKANTTDETSYSGIGVANFTAGHGKWGASEIRDNVIRGAGQMDFGIHAGKHGWDAGLCTYRGRINHNNIRGSFINLQIDGWVEGKILDNNTLSSPTGHLTLRAIENNPTCTVLTPKNFTVADDAILARRCSRFR